MTSPHPSPDADRPRPSSRAVARIPARAWLRPGLVLLGGLALTAVLWIAGQPVAAVVFALVTLGMAYWTSPLRSGPHMPFAEAMARRHEGATIILWAPGDPLSSRIHAALRNRHDDVLFVNVYQDAAAGEFLADHGGRAALPLVVTGEQVTASATVGDVLDLRAEQQHRRDA